MTKAHLVSPLLLIVDEVGYIRFDLPATNLMFMLVSRRCERVLLIVTSNKPFSGWGEIFGDDVAAAAMRDRLVHHAQILALKGDSYRVEGRDLAPRVQSARVGRFHGSGLAGCGRLAYPQGRRFSGRVMGRFLTGLDRERQKPRHAGPSRHAPKRTRTSTRLSRTTPSTWSPGVPYPSRARQIVRIVPVRERYGHIGRSGCCHRCQPTEVFVAGRVGGNVAE
jgi:hypothetical protein